MGRKEEALVSRIRTIFDAATVPVSIGDDSAVIDVAGRLAITNDLLVEDVDFTRAIPLEMIGRKALAVNLSDLAAMGARPLYFVLALALPHDLVGDVERLLGAMADEARKNGIALIGGDLSSAAKLTISITAFGAVDRPLLRSGAKAGERIYVSRPLGGSAAGLHLLEQGWTMTKGEISPPLSLALGYAHREFGAAAIRHHCAPTAEVALGMKLGALNEISSCLDISDGLSTDLHRLCAASDVGADIEWERVPLFPDLMQSGRSLGISPEEASLHGGEELALLFTSTLRESELSERVGRPVYSIGRIRTGRGITLFRGEASVPLGDHGFDHFT